MNLSSAGTFGILFDVKVLNFTEDAHRKSMSMFETDEHLRALMFVRSAF